MLALFHIGLCLYNVNAEKNSRLNTWYILVLVIAPIASLQNIPFLLFRSFGEQIYATHKPIPAVAGLRRIDGISRQ